MNFCCEYVVWDIIKIVINYKVINVFGEKYYGLNYYFIVFVVRCIILFLIRKDILNKKLYIIIKFLFIFVVKMEIVS